MGKKIDQITGMACMIVGVFILCLRILGNIPLACATAFAICAIIRRISCKMTRTPRMTSRDARQILNSWAYLPEDEALRQISKLTAIDADSPEAVLILRPIGFTLSKSDVFTQWKRHAGQARLIILSTCYSDGQARVFSDSLSAPTVQLIDASKMIPMVRRSSLDPPQRKPIADIAKRMKHIISILPEKYPWKKSLLFGLLMMFLYLLRGRVYFLMFAIFAWLLAGISIRTRKV